MKFIDLEKAQQIKRKIDRYKEMSYYAKSADCSILLSDPKQPYDKLFDGPTVEIRTIIVTYYEDLIKKLEKEFEEL